MYIPKKIKEIIGDVALNKDTVGMSNSSVFVLENMVLKAQSEDFEAKNEVKILSWLRGKLPVPDIIEHISENGCSYILMSKCQGKMACDDEYMKKPMLQARLLAETLNQLWSVNISICPCNWQLERKLLIASQNVENGSVDLDNTQPDTFGPGGFKDPEHLLYWLMDNQPTEELVLSHGDFCLPNIYFNDNTVSGLIDLGKCGIADKWTDIALCYRSLSNNFSGMYHGRSYSGFEPEMLFDGLGIRPDYERIRYYILLDELF